MMTVDKERGASHEGRKDQDRRFCHQDSETGTSPEENAQVKPKIHVQGESPIYKSRRTVRKYPVSFRTFKKRGERLWKILIQLFIYLIQRITLQTSICFVLGCPRCWVGC